jgi:hypothetical protein
MDYRKIYELAISEISLIFLHMFIDNFMDNAILIVIPNARYVFAYMKKRNCIIYLTL